LDPLAGQTSWCL